MKNKIKETNGYLIEVKNVIQTCKINISHSIYKSTQFFKKIKKKIWGGQLKKMRRVVLDLRIISQFIHVYAHIYTHIHTYTHIFYKQSSKYNSLPLQGSYTLKCSGPLHKSLLFHFLMKLKKMMHLHFKSGMQCPMSSPVKS